MTDGDILRIFGLNTSKLALGVSVWIPTLLFIIGLSNLTELLNTISGTDPLPNGVTSYLYILLFFLPSAVLGVLLAEFYDYLLYQYLKSTFNNSKQSFTWWCYPFLSLILPVVFITLIFFWTTFNPKFHLGWTIFFIGWTILLITISYLVFWKKFLSTEDSNFEFFELAYPWDSWDDPALTKYRDILSTRLYLISSIITTLSWIGVSSLRNVPTLSFVNLTFLHSYDIDGRTPYLIVFFLILLLIFLFTSLRQKAKKKKDRDILSLTKSLENSEIFREIRERISEKHKSSSFFTELETPVQLIETIEEYTEIYRHNFKNNCRLPTYLNLISIIHINVSASQKIKELIKKHFPRNGNEVNSKMGPRNRRSTVIKEREAQYSEDLSREFESVLDATIQSSEELKKKNYEQSVVYLFFQFRRLVHIIEGYYIGSSTKEEEPLTKEEVEYLKQLSKGENTRIRRTIAKNLKTPPEVLEQLAKDEDLDVRKAIAANPKTPLEVLKELTKNEGEEIRWIIAMNLKSTPEMLKEFTEHADPYIREEVARNPKASPEMLKKLANDENLHVRWVVAVNPKTPPEILEKFANDNKSNLHDAVAANSKTPPEILKKLANDENLHVRSTVAANSKTPPEILKKLANDESLHVRSAVAENPKTPIEILKKLANDNNEYVRRNIAGNQKTPVKILEELASDKNSIVSSAVAGNQKTPVKILKELANDDEYVRSAVGRNPKTPSEILEKLANDESLHVRSAVAENPKTRKEM